MKVPDKDRKPPKPPQKVTRGNIIAFLFMLWFIIYFFTNCTPEARERKAQEESDREMQENLCYIAKKYYGYKPADCN